jgi:type I restriction enzyme S subunit
MTNGWQTVQLGDVLKRVKSELAIDDSVTYKQVTVRLWNKGVILRGEQEGVAIKTKRQFYVKTGQLLMSRIDVRHGAIGLVPKELDGAIVSNDFWVYDFDENQIYPEFLTLYVKTPGFIEDANRTSSGTTKRIRAEETAFLNINIPLPPLIEQRRIVAHIESLAARVKEAQRLREEADYEINSLLISMAHRSDVTKDKLLEEGWTEVRLGDVIQQMKDRCRVEPNTEYPNLGIYSFARGLFHKQPIDGNLTSAKELYQVHKGQFIYSRLFAFEGACGFITNEYDGCYVSGEYPTFDCDPEIVKPEFLFAYFKSLGIWKEISAGSKGLGDRRQRVQAEKFLEHRLLLPPLEWQSKIVSVMAKVNALQELQSATGEELSALLPSVLDKAFKGEL